jgi:CBS domain-containing protein
VYEPEQSVLCILTHRAVLRHVVEFFQPSSAPGGAPASLSGFFQRSPHKLGIGTFDSVTTLPDSTLLVDVLSSMAAGNVSAIPLTGSGGGVTDIFTREDVMLLALHDDLAALQQAVAALKGAQRDIMRGDTELVTCARSDSMQHLLQLFGTTGVHRVVEVDASGMCTGIISLSDLFGYLQGFMQAVADDDAPTPKSVSSEPSSGSKTVEASPALQAAVPSEQAIQHAQLSLDEQDAVLGLGRYRK